MSLRFEDCMFPSAAALAAWRRASRRPVRLGSDVVVDDPGNQLGAVLRLLKRRGLVLAGKVTPKNFLPLLYSAALTKAAAEGKGDDGQQDQAGQPQAGYPPAQGDQAPQPVGMSHGRDEVADIIATMTGRRS
jgi:hypothetical protein